jgi:tetratricopeptide (TPR) repeat protein
MPAPTVTVSAPMAQAPAQPAPAAAPISPAPAALAGGLDSDSLRDMLIAAVSAGDSKLLNTLATSNREAILANFTNWQKPPDAVRQNNEAMQRYATTLIALAEMFRDKFKDESLVVKLSAPAQNQTQQQWEQGLAQAEALAKDMRLDEAKNLLGQVLAFVQNLPTDGPIPYHAVTHGRLAHTLFSKGEIEPAYGHMLRALQFSEQRGDDNGVAASLRGIYEINRYLGKTAEAAAIADRLSAQFTKLGNATDSQWWQRQAERVRAGEPLLRIVFFLNDQQYEVDDVPKLTEGRVRYGFVRNRPPIALCEATVQRGIQAGTQAKFDEALALFREAARIDPYDPSSHYQAALALMHLQRPAEAVAEFDAVDKLGPGWFNSRADRWVAAEIAGGRLEPAIFFILRTEEMPDQSATWDQKLSLCDQAISRVGEIAPLLLYRGRCLMRLGRMTEADPVLRGGVEKATEPDVRTRLLVDLQMITQDIDEKRKMLQEAIALNGNLAATAVARVALNSLEIEILRS